MRALNTTPHPKVGGAGEPTISGASPRIDLERPFVQRNANPPDPDSVSAAPSVVPNGTTDCETVTLEDGTQIVFGTINLLAKQATA